MDVSVVIISYNTRDLTLPCIDSIYRHTTGLDFEILVVDNASADGSPEAIGDRFPGVRLLRQERNIGFGPANNVGIREAGGEFVFLLNSDTLLLDNALPGLTEFMRRPGNERIGCCGGLLFNADRTPQASYGHSPSVVQVLFDQTELRRLFRSFYMNRLAVAVPAHPDAVTRVPYVSGADLFVRRSALETVGLFDEDFFLYFEETDLCRRMDEAGYRCVIVPEVRILHYFGQSSGGFAMQRMKHFKRSELLYFRKSQGAVMREVVRVLYLLGYAARFLLTWKRTYAQLFRITATA
jgi:hypothetical protein